MRDFLALMGMVTLWVTGLGLVAGLFCGAKEIISKLKYNYRVKHRFDKPPTAKCYCRDCKYHSSETNRCYRFGETTKEYRCTADNWFCWEAEPLAEEHNNRNTDMGNVSDGYHTFNELYDHRAWLFATICREHKDLAWKSKLHHDGSMYDGMFIVGISTPLGQATYHYDIDPYWLAFDVKEVDKAPEWDGHTPKQALDRIYSLTWVKKDHDKIAEEVMAMLMSFCDDDDQISIKKCELEVNLNSIIREYSKDGTCKEYPDESE